MKTISYFTIKYKIYFGDFEKKKPKMKIAFLYFVFINICVCILNNKFPNFTYIYFILLLSLFRDEKKNTYIVNNVFYIISCAWCVRNKLAQRWQNKLY